MGRTRLDRTDDFQKFCRSGLDSDWKISQPAHLCQLALYQFFIVTSATKCNRRIYMFHWMLVAPHVLKSVLPVADSFSKWGNAHILSYPRTSAYQWNSQHKFLMVKNKASFCQLRQRCSSGSKEGLWCISMTRSSLSCVVEHHVFKK